MEPDLSMAVNTASLPLTPLQQLLLQEETRSEQISEGNTELFDSGAQKKKSAKRIQRKSTRPGFRMDSIGLRKKFMRANVETKLFIHPCLLRFVVYYRGKLFMHDVYPMDNISEWAHFLFRVYSPDIVQLRIIHRDPEGFYRPVVNTAVRREFIGALNCFGSPIPRYDRKRFCLCFLPWRKKKFTVVNWNPNDHPRP